MTKPAHSAREIAADVAAGRTTAVETAKAALGRIEAAKALNAVVTIDPERTVADAAAVDVRLRAGETMSLAGVPVVVKDNIWVGGWRVTQGSCLFADFIAPQRCDCDRAAAPRRRCCRRHRGNIRVRQQGRHHLAAVWADTASAKSRTDAGRIVGRTRRSRRSRPCAARDRHRCRWLQPQAAGPCRRRRFQAILRRDPLWARFRRAILRPVRHRADRHGCRRYRPGVRSHGRRRSARSGLGEHRARRP